MNGEKEYRTDPYECTAERFGVSTKTGQTDDRQCVERDLYVCDESGLVTNADSSGAENIRQKVLPNPSQIRDNGWLAQPAVHLFDRIKGRFGPENRSRTANRSILTVVENPRPQ